MVDFLIRKRTAVFTASLLIIIVGIIAYINLPRESNPEIKQPWIFVNTVYAGVAPKEIESLITQPLEEELDGIEGINKISSSSRQSVSSIFVEFDADTEVETALRRVKDRIDAAKADLPDEAEEPRVAEFSSTDWPIFILVLSHPDGVLRIDEEAERLKESLKRLPGVLDVEISGNSEREVAIEIDPAKLHTHGLSLGEVAQAIRNENASIPGGELKSEAKTFTLSVTGELKDPSGFAQIVVADGPGKVKLGDLGKVAFTTAEAESLARLNGRPAITIEIKKRTGANMIDLSQAIKQTVEERKAAFPTGTELVYSYDESRFIEETIVDLENNMFSGFILVLLVTLFFLGFRNSLFVSLAIPFSMLISFFVLQMMGITLNMVVLFSLIMALGMLVDNGIVIVENIFRHASMGKDRMQAAADGANEVAGPIIASTITTCLAFFPIIFMPGIMGQFMSYLPITIITVLVSSLFVALSINPVFCSRFMSISEKDMRRMQDGSGLFSRVQDLYTGLLRSALKHPLKIAAGSVTVVVVGIALYALIGKEPVFFPESDPPTAIIKLEARQGTPLEATDRMVRSIEERIPGVETSMDHFQTVVGSAGGGDYHKASIRVEFVPFLEREISGYESTENLKKALAGFTGAKISFEEIENGPPDGHPISYKVTGDEYPVIGSIAEQAEAILEEYDELKGISSDYESSRPEIAVEVDRKKAAFHGLSTAEIAMTVRNAFQGSTVGTYRDGAEEYDINLRYAKEFRDSINRLQGLKIPAGNGKLVPLSSVASISFRSDAGVIKRTNRERSVEVWADFKPDIQNKAEISAEIDARLKGLSLPAGYQLGTGEGLEIQQESSTFLAQAFMIALFLILIVLIAQFNSIADPAIIILSVFLSMGGVFWGYALTGMSFVVMMSGIGCIALAGVAVNNCIVLVDYTNRLMREGMPWNEAIIESGRTRLRPVLLTAITTVLGMIPMALGISFNIHTLTPQIGSEQSEFWKAFAWAMIFGLSFSTLMTLVVVPVLLKLKFNVLHRGQRKVLEAVYRGAYREGFEAPLLEQE